MPTTQPVQTPRVWVRPETSPGVMGDTIALADILKALADTIRLQILHLLLMRGELCVCELMAHVHLTQSHVSFHLKTLKFAGLVTARKEGKWMYYALNRSALAQCLVTLGDLFDFSQWPEITEPALCDAAGCPQHR